MKMLKFDLGKKHVISIFIGLFVTVFVLASIFVYAPVLARFKYLRGEIKRLEKDNRMVASMIDSRGDIDYAEKLVGQEEIVKVIDDIAQTGKLFDIQFFSIMPGKIEQSKGLNSRLPVVLNLVAEYKNFGDFLGRFNRFDKNIVTVKSFEIRKKENFLPRIEATLVLEIHLKES